MLKQNIILAAICFASPCLFLNNANAASFTLGANAWNNNIDLDGTYQGFHNEFDSNHDYKPVIWADISHSIPFVPNLKLRYTYLEKDSSSLIKGEIKIDDVVFENEDFVSTTTKLSHFDIVPYYNVINNDVVTLGLGLDIKVGNFKISAWDDYVEEEIEYTGALPLPYASINVNLPFDFSIKADGAGLKVKDYTFYDIEAALSWKAINTDVLDASIEAGYRKIYAAADDVHDLDVKLKSDGFFAGISLSY
jgi:outer membrane protein